MGDGKLSFNRHTDLGRATEADPKLNVADPKLQGADPCLKGADPKLEMADPQLELGIHHVQERIRNFVRQAQRW